MDSQETEALEHPVSLGITSAPQGPAPAPVDWDISRIFRGYHRRDSPVVPAHRAAPPRIPIKYADRQPSFTEWVHRYFIV